MEMRVEQLAAQAGVAVDTVRYYQASGLLSPPRREGRHGWYSHEHLERIARIRSLQARGLSLAVIKRLLAGELDAADEALAAAVSNDVAGGAPAETEFLTLEGVAERSGIPLPLLQAIEREGLLAPRRIGGQERYTAEDVEVARAGLVLLEAGLPLPEVLDLARRHHACVQQLAHDAVELFDTYVRHPIRNASFPEEEAASRLVDAFNRLLPATNALVGHHFQRTLLTIAQEHIERVGADAELEAVEVHAARTR